MFKPIDEKRAMEIYKSRGIERGYENSYFAYDERKKLIMEFETKEQRDRFCKYEQRVY